MGEQNVPLAVRVNIEGLHNVIELSKQCEFEELKAHHDVFSITAAIHCRWQDIAFQDPNCVAPN